MGGGVGAAGSSSYLAATTALVRSQNTPSGGDGVATATMRCNAMHPQRKRERLKWPTALLEILLRNFRVVAPPSDGFFNFNFGTVCLNQLTVPPCVVIEYAKEGEMLYHDRLRLNSCLTKTGRTH